MEALRVDKVGKSFGRFQALKNVDLFVKSGERRAIIGPNGAGKTTLFNIIAGQHRPTHGRVYLGARDITGMRPDQIWSHGLVRTFQRNQLFLGLTVAQNIELACAAHFQTWQARRRRRDVMAAAVTDILAQVHLSAHAATPTRKLAYGAQRQLELALALAGKPAMLLLDEPTAGMSPAETESIVALLSKLSREITLLIVEHDMDVVFTLADSITVLHLGEVLAVGSPQEIQSNEEVRKVYMGSQGRA